MRTCNDQIHYIDSHYNNHGRHMRACDDQILLLVNSSHCNDCERYVRTAEPAYSYNVYSRFSAMVKLNLVPFAFVSLLFYPCYSRILL